MFQLEKTTGSPIPLLNQAAQIVGIDLVLCASHPEINPVTEVRTSSAPKAEWTLRWLIKKLKNGKSFRLHHTTFLLFAQLIGLVETKALAVILSDFDFLSVLDETLSDLEEAVFAGLEDGFADIEQSGPESSLTLDSSQNQNEAIDQKGTKRKRSLEGGSADAMEIDDSPQTPAACLLAFIRLLDCVFNLLVFVAEDLGVDENTRSRLTKSIGSEPESGAIKLARAFRTAAVGVSYFFQRRMTTDLLHLMYVIPALQGMWRLKSTNKDSSPSKESDESFAKHCLPSALRLTHCLGLIDLDADEKSQALFGTQRLIALHVTLPARMSFLERGGSGIDYSAEEPDWSAVQPVTETFRPLLKETAVDSGRDSKERPVPSQGGKVKDSWKTTQLLPELFDNAARSTPRDTFGRQTQEGPWLETLFVAVAELAFSFAQEESPDTCLSEFVGALEQLLQIVLERDIKLSLATLVSHAVYTGVLKDDLAEVEWNLTALLVKLGVDIFLPSSGFGESQRLLGGLLHKIMLYWCCGGTDEDYEIIKHGIVIPLARGFTAARDLPTFIATWHNQLTFMEGARSRTDGLSFFSVWEDEDLCTAYSELVQTPFMDANIATQMQSAATSIRGKDGNISTSPDSYAKFVVLEASLRCRKVNLAAADETLRSIVETLSAAVSSERPFHWRWRLWRLARNLFENHLQPADNPLRKSLMGLKEAAAKAIHRRHEDFTKHPCAQLENFEAYRFTLATMKEVLDPSRLSNFNSITEEVSEVIRSVSNGQASISMNLPWDGRPETLNSLASLALSYFVLLVANPTAWKQIQVATRRSMFEHMLSLAASQYDPSSSLENISDARFLQAWASLACHEYLLNVPYLISDLIHVMSERFKVDVANRKLLVESLQRIPASSFSRRDRCIVLDLLQEAVIQQSSPLEVTVGMVSLMAKLADLPKSPAAVTSSWHPIWEMARAVSLEGIELDLQTIKAFRSLNRAVLAKLLVLSPGDRSKQFKKLHRSLESTVSKMRSDEAETMEHVLLRISLAHLWDNRETLSNVIEEPQLNACRKKVFESVVDSVKRVKAMCKKQEAGQTVAIIKALDALEDFQDLATGNEEVGKLLKKIEGYVEKSADFGPMLRRLIRRVTLARQEPESEMTSPVMRCAEIFPIQHLYGEEQQLFIRTTMEKFRTMTEDGLIEVMREITSQGGIGSNHGHHLLVAALVSAAVPSVEDKDSPQADELSDLFTVVGEFLPRCKTVEQFTIATECLHILFHHHPRCVDQFDVDGLLTVISMCLSRSGPRINPKYASTVYIRTCRLVGVVVGIMRQRLGGRHHLVTTILKKLLSCLLDRTMNQGRALEKDKDQAYWVAPLQATEAAHFARLLTSLSDPTLSSVSRPTAHEGLTDQTKKAKLITGQYLQYFIKEYARMCLRGTFPPQTKATIMPGLYSILDSLPQETTRSLNAELEVSSRAVFKGLYNDYVKFGKWNKA